MVVKKSLLCLLIIALILVPAASAVIEVTEKEDKGSVIIAELNNPAVFNFKINNLDGRDSFEIYSLLGISMSPKGTFELTSGTNDLEVRVYPNEDVRKIEGFFSFEYQIRSSKGEIFKDDLRIRIVPLKSALSLEPEPLAQGADEAVIKIRNKENTNLDDVKVHLTSAFFDAEKSVSLGPYEEQEIRVGIDKEKARKLVAGPYVVSAAVEYEKVQTKIEGILKYLEKEGTSVTQKTEGWIIRKTTITKTNEGNTNVKASIDARRDVVSRLVTVYSAEPAKLERRGLFVYYTWEKELGPTESFGVSITTNYTFPFILIVLIVLVVLFAKAYSRTGLTVSKRVSFVKTKGGEFALKVRLYVNARKNVDKIQIIDSLPGLTKLYEKFGTQPNRIDASTRRLFWNIDRLAAGEERVFSYIIYSKVAVTGRFELPAATAVYNLDGKTQETWSNRTFFVAESGARGFD